MSNDFHSVYGCVGAQHLCDSDRENNDFYATHPSAAEWLVKLEDLDKNIWEPSCGEGHLSKVFEQYGFNVKSTDLIYRGFGQGGVDFFEQTEVFNGDIVTNPPYKYALPYIKHALTLIPEGHKVCLFLKVQFLEGKERKKFFKETPPKHIWVSSSRIQCGKNGVFQNSMVAYAWYVWEKGYKGDTILKWFN